MLNLDTLNLDTSQILSKIIDDISLNEDETSEISFTASELIALTNISFYIYNAFVVLEEQLESQGKTLTKQVSAFVDDLHSAFTKLNSI